MGEEYKIWWNKKSDFSGAQCAFYIIIVIASHGTNHNYLADPQLTNLTGNNYILIMA